MPNLNAALGTLNKQLPELLNSKRRLSWLLGFLAPWVSLLKNPLYVKQLLATGNTFEREFMSCQKEIIESCIEMV